MVNGATGTAGKLAVQIAKRMGAKKVIATGRDSAALGQVESLGADITINLLLEKEDHEAALREQFSGDGVDVVLDYLFGKSAETLLATIARTRQEAFKPIRYVVVGGASGQEITLPAFALLAVPVVLMGSGLGSVPWNDVIDAMSDVLQTVVPGSLQIDTTAVPLADVERTWNENNGKSRLVFVVK